MKFFLRPLVTLFVLVCLTNATGSFDRPCGDNAEDIWLDIVLVVDNSKGMANDNWYLIDYSIQLLFQMSRIGANNPNPKSTRVGFVTYNQDATIVADLNKFQSYNDLNQTTFTILSQVSDINKSYLAKGLLSAEQVLLSGRSNGYRSNYRQMIILYTAFYQGTGNLDPSPIATRLKNSGISIAVVDTRVQCTNNIADFNKNLQDVATVDMYYMICTDGFTGLYEAEIIANCYCPDTWVQYSVGGDNELKGPKGTCVKVFKTTTHWNVAKLACQTSITNGYLVTDFGTNKHTFLQSLFKNTTGLVAGYHIGLNFMNGQWYWQQPANYAPVSLQATISDDFNTPATFWNIGWPGSTSTNTGVATVVDDTQVGWENVNPYNNNEYYICEVDTCDSENYCP